MAWAAVPPHEAEKTQREQNLRERLNSIDPVTRFRAKEEVNATNMAEASRIAVGIAKRTESEYKSVIKHCDEIDRQAAERFKPLPSWAKNHIVKE